MTAPPTISPASPLAILAPIIWAVRIGGVILFVASFIVATSGPDSIDGISMGQVLPGAWGWVYLGVVAFLALATAYCGVVRDYRPTVALGLVVSLNATAAIAVHGSRAFLAAGVYLALGVILIAIGAVVRGLTQAQVRA